MRNWRLSLWSEPLHSSCHAQKDASDPEQKISLHLSRTFSTSLPSKGGRVMQGHRWLPYAWAMLAAGLLSGTVSGWARADVEPGDVISKANLDKADALLIP